MGKGYRLTCSNCGGEYEVLLGVGFGFPSVYEELVEDIEAGRYGEEWREIAAETEHFAIDAENRLYWCGKCGHWECVPGLSIYAPKDVGKVLATRFGDKTVREWGRVPYVAAKELEEDYELVKERVHVCGRCGHDMRMLSERGLSRAVLKCPDCDGRLERDLACIRWD